MVYNRHKIYMKKIVMILVAVIGFGMSSAIAQSKVTCPKCSGSKKEVQKCPNNCHNGAIFCNSCSGSGQKKSTCSGCGGSGYTTRTVQNRCSNCNGVGYFSKNNPTTCTGCGGAGQRQGRTCGNCRGKGQIDNISNIACRPCGGRGTISKTKQEKHSCNNGYVTNNCGTCSGRGSYMCSRCQGYASIQTDCSRCRGAGYVFVYNE